MPKKFGFDGTIVYAYPDAITDVTWGGQSVLSYQPVEILVQPDGWGRVTLLVSLDTANTGGGAGPRVAGQKKAVLFPTTSLQQVPGNLLDGTTRTYTYWGKVVVTP